LGGNRREKNRCDVRLCWRASDDLSHRRLHVGDAICLHGKQSQGKMLSFSEGHLGGPHLQSAWQVVGLGTANEKRPVQRVNVERRVSVAARIQHPPSGAMAGQAKVAVRIGPL